MSSNSDMSGSEVGHKKQKSESGELFFTISNSTPTHHFKTSAQGWCTGKTQRDGMEREAGGGLGWGTHVNPWLIHVNVWQKPLQYCEVISLQLIKINGKNMYTVLLYFF